MNEDGPAGNGVRFAVVVFKTQHLARRHKEQSAGLKIVLRIFFSDGELTVAITVFEFALRIAF